MFLSGSDGTATGVYPSSIGMAAVLSLTREASSNIAGAGKGVFAAHAVSKGTTVDYAFQQSSEVYIDVVRRVGKNE